MITPERDDWVVYANDWPLFSYGCVERQPTRHISHFPKSLRLVDQPKLVSLGSVVAVCASRNEARDLAEKLSLLPAERKRRIAEIDDDIKNQREALLAPYVKETISAD